MLFGIVALIGDARGQNLASWPVFLACFFLYHFVVMAFGANSFGKMAMEISVVDTSGRPPAEWQALVRAAARVAPALLLNLPLLDSPAQSELLQGACRIVFAMATLAEFALLQGSVTRQTLADRVARTLVVNSPGVQPHRAPAVPMFSATDGEFGTPPKVAPKQRRRLRQASVIETGAAG